MSYVNLRGMGEWQGGPDAPGFFLAVDKDCPSYMTKSEGFPFDSCQCPDERPYLSRAEDGTEICSSTKEGGAGIDAARRACIASGLPFDFSTLSCASQGVVPGRPETGWVDPRAGTQCGPGAIYNTSGDCVGGSTTFPTGPGATPTTGGKSSGKATAPVPATTPTQKASVALPMVVLVGIVAVAVFLATKDKKHVLPSAGRHHAAR